MTSFFVAEPEPAEASETEMIQKQTEAVPETENLPAEDMTARFAWIFRGMIIGGIVLVVLGFLSLVIMLLIRRGE